MIKLEFDESKEMEFFINFHGAHILRINTTDSDIFLKEAKIFDSEVIKNLDSENRCKIIYIVDKLPPLSAVLTFVQSPSQK